MIAPPSKARDAMVSVDWRRVLFIHYRIAPEVLRAHVPRDFQIDTFDGTAWLTLVALTMRRFRPTRPLSLRGWLFALRGEQRFLNARTYVRHGDEAGALFLWGWLSRPFNVPVPDRPFALPCGFAEVAYEHSDQRLRGEILNGRGRFSYRAEVKRDAAFAFPERGSLPEFALERYHGFYSLRGAVRHFRAWHEPWKSTPVELSIKDRSLIDTLPCFAKAEVVAAHYTRTLSPVFLGAPRRIETPHGHHGASSFFTMP